MSNDDELERILQRAWEMARLRWPQFTLPYPDYARFVLHIQGDGAGKLPVALVETLALLDLYLVLACLRSVQEALQILEHEYLSKLPGLLGYLKLPAMELDEVCQMVRIHLLLGTTETGPQLSEYRGRGPLLNWMKIIAVRMALRLSGAHRRDSEENLPAIINRIPAPGANPEFELIKRRFRAEFHQAVRQALVSLPRHQRYLLRLHFMDQLSTTELGTLFGKNQSTISRWLKSAREEVYERTKHFLQERLGLNSRDFASLLTDIRSQLDVYISQFLVESPALSGDDPTPNPLLHRAWEMARLRWPQLTLPYLDYARFVLHIQEDVAGKPPEAPVDALALLDLYLVLTCLRFVQEALQVMEDDYLSKLPGLLGHLKLPPTKLNEVCQMVRIQLLSGTTHAGPQLNEYRGQSPLINWIKEIAVRMAQR